MVSIHFQAKSKYDNEIFEFWKFLRKFEKKMTCWYRLLSVPSFDKV